MAKHLEMDDGEAAQRDPVAPYGYKKDGTPKGAPGRPRVNVKPTVPSEAHAAPPRRNAPNPVRKPAREQTREMAREPSRSGAVVAIGRDGQQIVRRRPTTDIDMLDQVMAPAGWSYQWNAVSAIGKEMDKIELQMIANGWTPVPSSRHPGLYTAPGYEGQIVVGGLRLEERPKALTVEAQEEDKARARQKVRDQTDALRLTQSQLPGANAGRAKAASGMRMQIDKSFELPPDENYDFGDE